MDGSMRSGAGAELEALFRRPRAVAPGSLIGIEHEYVVRRAGMPIDFRDLLHQLAVPGLRLDPGDANAYRLTSGLALTCDEGEAEIATPPIAVRPGFVGASVEWARHGRAQLEGLLPAEHEAEGYSTHLSAAMPSPWGDEVADLYARTFAPALALLLERPDSQGIYVRPRPGRLELCGEFVEGARLGAVAAFVAGSSRAAALVVAGHRASDLPPEIAVRTLPAVERYGLRVTRYACGLDLYAEGRDARLPLAEGGVIPAQLHLEIAWRIARAALNPRACTADLQVLDRMVAGALPLGVETHGSEAPWPSVGTAPSSPLGQVTGLWQRPGFVLRAVVATWDFTVFRVEGSRANALVSIPRESLPHFIARLEAGGLDRPLLVALERAALRPMLSHHQQTHRVGVFPGMGDPAELLPVEREPESGLSKPARDGRPGKAGEGPLAGRIGKSSSRRRKLVIPTFPRPIVPLPVGDTSAPGTAPGPAPLPLPPPPAESIPPPGPAPFLPLPPPAESIPPPQPPTYPERPPLPPPVAPLPATGGSGVPWLVVAAVATIGLLGAIAVGAVAANNSGSDPTPSPAPVETATRTAEPIPSPTSTTTVALATPTSTPKVDAAGALPTSTNVPTSTPTPVPPTATSQPIPTVTPNPTETAIPPATATKFATETPPPTPTRTPTPTPTSTATPTRTPIPTPTRILDIPSPTPTKTVAPGCTPVPGAVCP